MIKSICETVFITFKTYRIIAKGFETGAYVNIFTLNKNRKLIFYGNIMKWDIREWNKLNNSVLRGKW